MFNFFSVSIFIFVLLVLGVVSFYRKNKEKNIMNQIVNLRMLNMEIIKNFESYVSVLEYYMNRGYDIIFKDQIMIYSIEATKLDDKHFDEISKQFMTLVLKLMGKTLQQEFEYLYGDKETLLFNITEYFNRRYEDDEVRRSAQKNLMEDNDEDMEENPNPLTMNI